MGTIILIILGVAVLGAVIGFIGSGGKAEGAAFLFFSVIYHSVKK